MRRILKKEYPPIIVLIICGLAFLFSIGYLAQNKGEIETIFAISSFALLFFTCWGIYMALRKKPYKIVTDGIEYRIKFPYGTVGCVSYKSVEEAEKEIEKRYIDDLEEIEDKKKIWRVIRTIKMGDENE